MLIRLDREQLQSRAAGRNDKTSIDLLEHVQGGVQIERLAEMRFRKDSSRDAIDAPPSSTPKRAADAEATVPRVRHRSRLRRR
jgi:hypothetical protein